MGFGGFFGSWVPFNGFSGTVRDYRGIEMGYSEIFGMEEFPNVGAPIMASQMQKNMQAQMETAIGRSKVWVLSLEP